MRVQNARYARTQEGAATSSSSDDEEEEGRGNTDDSSDDDDDEDDDDGEEPAPQNGDGKPAAVDSVALVNTAAQKAVQEAQLVAQEPIPEAVRYNSSSHRKDYMEFIRACGNKNKFPISLAPAFRSDKTDLFQQWMECEKDWRGA